MNYRSRYNKSLIINDSNETRQKSRQNNRGQRLLEEFKNQSNMNVTFCNYKPARLYSADRDTSKEGYIIYSYLIPATQDKYKQFKERFDMNRIPSADRRYEYGKAAERFMNQKLQEGFNPFEEINFTATKTPVIEQQLKIIIKKTQAAHQNIRFFL